MTRPRGGLVTRSRPRHSFGNFLPLCFTIHDLLQAITSGRPWRRTGPAAAQHALLPSRGPATPETAVCVASMSRPPPRAREIRRASRRATAPGPRARAAGSTGRDPSGPCPHWEWSVSGREGMRPRGEERRRRRASRATAPRRRACVRHAPPMLIALSEPLWRSPPRVSCTPFGPWLGSRIFW